MKRIFINRYIRKIIEYKLEGLRCWEMSINTYPTFPAATNFKKKIHSLYEYFKVIFLKKISIPTFEFILTTKCSLKCKDCASLMPYYKRDANFTLDFENYKTKLDNVLKVVDKIYQLKLQGGEALLVKDLEKIIEYTVNKKQIVYPCLITNCTIEFSEDLLDLLEKYNKRIYLVLSNYSSNPKLEKRLKIEKIKEQLNKRKIYYAAEDELEWGEVGKIQPHNRNKEELRKIHKTCWQRDCIAYANGELHPCSRSYMIYRNMESNDVHKGHDCINFNVNYSKYEFFKMLKKFYEKKFFYVCDYCEFTGNIIKPAEQIEDIREIINNG